MDLYAPHVWMHACVHKFMHLCACCIHICIYVYMVNAYMYEWMYMHATVRKVSLRLCK